MPPPASSFKSSIQRQTKTEQTFEAAAQLALTTLAGRLRTEGATVSLNRSGGGGPTIADSGPVPMEVVAALRSQGWHVKPKGKPGNGYKGKGKGKATRWTPKVQGEERRLFSPHTTSKALFSPLSPSYCIRLSCH